MDDIFTQSAAHQYGLGSGPLATWPLMETTPYFTRRLFPEVLLAEPNLAGEDSVWLNSSRHRLTAFSTCGMVLATLMVGSWHHYYNQNWQSGINVLMQAEAFMDIPSPQEADEFGNLRLPLLSPIRDATLAYGDYRDRGFLADMGLYQGARVGPYVEQTYIQLLERYYLPLLINGLIRGLNVAPPGSGEKLAVLRVVRMMEDKSGHNNEAVKQYIVRRRSDGFHGQRDIQAQLMMHLDYALEHTGWHTQRQSSDSDAVSHWTPYDKPITNTQQELSKLPVYQRVYQTLRTKVLSTLPADLNLRDQVGLAFDNVFIVGNDEKLVIPQLLTRYGLRSYFVKQREDLVELTALDSWVLNLTQSITYNEADHEEIQRHITGQYISGYTATWRTGMDNLNVRDYEAMSALTDTLEQIISGDQPFQRVLTALRDNTHALTLSGELDDKAREAAINEVDYHLLSRLGHGFAPENNALEEQKDRANTLQVVCQQLTELHHYLLAIQNSPVPGESALKAVQLRPDQSSSDPIFATCQMARTLPAPPNR